MSETRKRSKAESVEELGAQIQSMEAELTDYRGEPLSWDEVTSTTAEKLAKKEQRRGVLPHLINAAKVRQLELQRAGHERELAALQEKQRTDYEHRVEATNRRHKAMEDEGFAIAELRDCEMRIAKREERIRRVDNEIRELRDAR